MFRRKRVFFIHLNVCCHTARPSAVILLDQRNICSIVLALLFHFARNIKEQNNNDYSYEVEKDRVVSITKFNQFNSVHSDVQNARAISTAQFVRHSQSKSARMIVADFTKKQHLAISFTWGIDKRRSSMNRCRLNR